MQYDARIHIKVKKEGDMKSLKKIKTNYYELPSDGKKHIFDINITDFCVDGDWSCPTHILKEFVGKIGKILEPIGGIVVAESICYSVNGANRILYDFGNGLHDISEGNNKTGISIIDIKEFINKKISKEKLDSKEVELLGEYEILSTEDIKKHLDNEKERFIAKVRKKQNGFALLHASDELRNDKEVVVAAVKAHGWFIFNDAGEEIKGNKEVVSEIVRIDGLALQYASKELRNDKEIVLEAIKNTGAALKYASKELRNDKEVVLEAVKKTGYALLDASSALKRDKELAIASVTQTGKFDAVLDIFKDDKDVVLAAVNVNGKALRYASKRLKDDEEIVQRAIKNDKDAIKYASKRIQERSL